jgi:di/tricarboxylate transporter
LTHEIAIVFATVAVAVFLFISERIRVDVVALMVLVSLALTSLITPAEALSGFSNAAVVTVWAMLILSGGLARTGVAGLVGRPLLRLAGHSEARLIGLIVLTAGTLSGFMNSVGVAALMLPVVVDLAHRTGRPPSRLLMPLAFGSLLGGLTTLIGTPPNLLISEAMRQYGLEPFGMFDYTPAGVAVLLAGSAFLVLAGRHLLPARDIRALSDREAVDGPDFFGLRDRLFVVRVPVGSGLAGKTLAQSRLGAALGVNVVGILRQDHSHLAPTAATVLQAGDRLVVEGRLDRLLALGGRVPLLVEEDRLTTEQLLSAEIGLYEMTLGADSSLLGKTLEGIGFRKRYGAIVLALRRGEQVVRTNLDEVPLQRGDILLVQATSGQIEALRDEPDLVVVGRGIAREYRLEERLMAVRVPDDSPLVGKTLVESRLGDAFGLGVMGIVREGTTHLMPAVEERLMAGDRLLVKGRSEDVVALDALPGLEVDPQPPPGLETLESAQVGLAEVVLSPRTTLAGKNLREIHFREKYGLSVLALWREGRPYRTDLRDMALRFGDALLLYGPRQKLKVLGAEPDFLVLSEAAQEAPRLERAPLALAVMAAVLVPAIAGWMPLPVTALLGVVLMVLTGCLTMNEAYRAIEWQAVFLIAGMLPLGIALERTGAARLVAEGMVALIGAAGPLVVMAGLFLLAALASQVMPNAAVAVLLAPIAYSTAQGLGVSPYPLMMAVAVSSSAAFLSPVGHPANVLVMGPGGYRFSDYFRVGLPLVLVVLVVVMAAVPLLWPF